MATINGVEGIVIGMSDVTENVTAIATNVKNAIENADGHGIIRMTITQASGVLTLTDSLSTLDELLEEGDYFSLSTGNYASQEIIRVSGFTETDINIERGCFGTSQTSYAANTYFVYANKQTIDGVQISTKKFTAELGDWSEYSGNNLSLIPI